MKVKTKKDYRARRHMRLRKRLQGTAERPRLSVFLSNRHLYVQFVDDATGRTLAAASTQAGETRSATAVTVQKARELGAAAARAAIAAGIATVVFDRGGFAYTGRIRALADAAREAGLRF